MAVSETRKKRGNINNYRKKMVKKGILSICNINKDNLFIGANTSPIRKETKSQKSRQTEEYICNNTNKHIWPGNKKFCNMTQKNNHLINEYNV